MYFVFQYRSHAGQEPVVLLDVRAGVALHDPIEERRRGEDGNPPGPFELAAQAEAQFPVDIVPEARTVATEARDSASRSTVDLSPPEMRRPGPFSSSSP